jgi:deoxyribodipyrimidine photo-lyase
LLDNQALTAALNDAAEVIPVFILDTSLLGSERTQGYRLAWLWDGVRQLDADLRALRPDGGGLLIRRGRPAEQLLRLVHEVAAEAVYFNRDYSPYAVRRDDEVRDVLRRAGVAARSFKDLVIHDAVEVRSASGKPYEVYSPYRRAWEALPKPTPLPIPIEVRRVATPHGLASDPLPTAVVAAPQPIAPPGEANALQRLTAFAHGPLYRYAEDRNTPGVEGTSVLSPYLRWGMISPRTCYAAAQQALVTASTRAQRESITTWIGELVWREFNYQILENHPHIVTRSFRPVYDHIDWQDNPTLVDAWKSGRTGYPIVDAAMRQLNATGWMHNRVRMIAASFLVKDGLVDWRVGERYFMQRLLDGEAANNVGNWQWVAGTGTDAAPYFRIFNPTSQGVKFDPAGDFVRRWVPELANVPAALIHTPHQMTAMQQAHFGCHIGRDYPAPIVDHAQQRERALALYETARLVGGKG